MRYALITLLMGFLTACGGGGGAFIGEGGGSGSGDGSIGEVPVRLGSGFEPFQEGVVEIDQTSISAGGSTVIRVRLVRSNGTPFVQSGLSALFTSPCSARGLGKFSVTSGGAAANSFNFNDEGAINIVYSDQGCSASGVAEENVITAKVSVDEGEVQATGTITVQPGSAGSVLLVSPVETTELALNGGVATPDRPQSVKVEFRVVDNSGSQAPVQGQLVCFELSTSVGGIEFSPTQTITGSDGLASTTVSSGNVSTPVVVTATVAGAANSSSCAAIPQGARITQNDNIIISTGLPDQDGFSLAVSNLSPEAFAVDGVTVGVTASVNDLFNNPVRDGVVVFFTTEAGTIQDQCATLDGRCSVNWISNGERPFDGRTTVTAFTVGEESFVDANGNGVYDNGENFGDLTEPFFDADEDGVRSSDGLRCPGEMDPDAPGCIEEFEDFNGNSSFDIANGSFNGTRCASGCSAGNSLYVWQNSVIVMARSSVAVRIIPGSIDIPNDGSVVVAVEVFGIMPDGSEQTVPTGTVIEVSSDVGEFSGDSSFTTPATIAEGPQRYIVTLKDSGDPESGFLRVKATVPSGLISNASAPITQN